MIGYIPVSQKGSKLFLSGDRKMSLVKGMDFSGGVSAIDKFNKMKKTSKLKTSTRSINPRLDHQYGEWN